MRIESVKAIVTGGAGGIGSAIAEDFMQHGAQVLLVDRDGKALEAVLSQLSNGRGVPQLLVADLTSPQDRSRVCTAATDFGANVLINNAGLNHFGLFEDQPENQIDAAVRLNVESPIQLCRAMLPILRRQKQASIINVGSVFGAIGYPGYVTYSATKFALRGFTEALRRELSGNSIGVHYIAPRATRTRINSATVESMNAELGVAMDPPQRVAARIRKLLIADQPRAVMGWPEKVFVRVNGALPGLVDRALRRQLPIIQRYASQQSATRTALQPSTKELGINP